MSNKVTWHDLPQEIQEKMLERQLEQSGNKNPDVFIKDLTGTKSTGGFTWSLNEGYDFWREILKKGNFEKFYTKYPKKNPIKPEYESLYKKTFRVNRIPQEIDLEKIRELNLEYILNIPQSN